jgi:S-adenosylmethionine:tRNA ribosyltransferase-isomerase
VDLHSLEAYFYDLPKELIAKTPLPCRDHSRVMCVDREKGEFSELSFFELRDVLTSQDALVFNNSKVISARLLGKTLTGGGAEVFLLKPLKLKNQWEVLVRPGKKLQVGDFVFFGDKGSCEILESQEGGVRVVSFSLKTSFEEFLEEFGQIPLPPYMERKPSPEDSHRYQTVYASQLGSVAAPTAGLHFTKPLLESLKEKGVFLTEVTLHVGIGTFKPVQVKDIREHQMHEERYSITQAAADSLNKRPHICVGTTSLRSLESAATEKGVILPGEGETNLFISPGYRFKYGHSLITNFHLPGSSLLMLVSALGGYELIKEAYRKAVLEKYRFFSYGDAMWIR